MGGGEVVLGVDIGTTDTKVVVVSPGGRLLGSIRRRTAWDTTRGTSDVQVSALQVKDDVVLACLAALENVTERDGDVHVVGIGVTGMAESGVLVPASGEMAYPIIAWFDPRGTAQIADVSDEFSGEFPARTGLSPTSLPSFSKLLWMKSQLSVDFRGARWLNVPEYIVHALGGEQVTEPSLASRTGLLNQDSLSPYHAALDLLGASASFLPPLVSAGSPAGRVNADAPAQLRGAVLTVAGHDHPVASLAAGALDADALFDSCGTAEALVRVTDRVISPHERVALSRNHVAQGAHVVPGRRILLGGTKAGLLLRRTLAMLGTMTPQARSVLDEACPVDDVQLPARVEGGGMDDQTVRITLDSDDVTPAVVWRAALENVVAQTAGLVEVFDDMVGPATHMVAAGGWTKMRSYRVIKRRAFPGITFSDVDEPGAFGAAAIAAAAVENHPTESLHHFVGSFTRSSVG